MSKNALFTLHTSDFIYNKSCEMQKFSDDSAIVGCISERKEAEYRVPEPPAAQH